jgi:hypothetical protein
MKKLFSPTRLLRLALPALMVLTALQARAQPSSGGPVPTSTSTSAPTGVPLDGGASLLLVGGVGYALRKLRQRRAR